MTELRALARAHVQLQDIVAETVDLSPQRSNLRGCCPFHPDTAAGLYVGANGHFHCFSCGSEGDVVDWTMRLYMIDEAGAIERLLPPAFGGGEGQPA
nr:CHC2 zinc finger domain-containing protein [Sphingomonas sp. S2M10]